MIARVILTSKGKTTLRFGNCLCDSRSKWVQKVVKLESKWRWNGNQISKVLSMLLMLKWFKLKPKTLKMKPKGCQHAYQNGTRITHFGAKVASKSIRNRVGNADVFQEWTGTAMGAGMPENSLERSNFGSQFGHQFRSKLWKWHSKKYATTNLQKYMDLMPEASLDYGEIKWKIMKYKKQMWMCAFIETIVYYGKTMIFNDFMRT